MTQHDAPQTAQPPSVSTSAVAVPREAAIRVMMMPRDTNAHGTIFGGQILSIVDQAGAIVAQRHCQGRVVTVAIHAVDFKEPVAVGDIVSCYGSIKRSGRTSVTVLVEVEAERIGVATRAVTSAELVFVAIDENGKPRCFAQPQT